MGDGICQTPDGNPALAVDAKIAWSLMPPDCKDALAQIKRSGRMELARPEILADAEAQLKSRGKFSLLDVMCSLELAAERWLKAHPEKEAA